MESQRTYGEGCAVAHGLELIGERWALLIVRELLLGPKRFNALQAGIRQASANILSQRLHQMQDSGIVHRHKTGAPANTWVWELTPWGYELEPIVLAIGFWARVSPGLDRQGWFSPDALMLHLKARFDPATHTARGRYQIRLEENSYSIDIDDTAIRITRGDTASPSVIIESDVQTLTDIIKQRESLDHAITSASVRLTGDHHAAALLLNGQ